MGGHTQGPWTVEDTTQPIVTISAGGYYICRVHRKNARLIAAAPDLLAALEFYADQYCEGWCERSNDRSKFADCGGCLARHALHLAKHGAAPATTNEEAV